jgi:2,4-dienoyl-CoA reductase (NADPH2)
VIVGDLGREVTVLAANVDVHDAVLLGIPHRERAGRETELVYRPAQRKKRVAVLGGGPAGLSCAAVAAERGHEVTLYEKSGELGGQFNLAKKIPGTQEFAESVAYYAERLRRAGANVVLHHAPGEAELGAFDEVVLATGIAPRRPALPGIDHRSVASYVDVLSGRIAPGRTVVIIGAGGIGFDVALYLLERDARATLDAEAFDAHWGIVRDRGAAGGLSAKGPPALHPAHRITMLKRSATPFGATLGRTTGWVHRAELARNGVKMLKGVAYLGIDDAGVHVTIDGQAQTIPADTVVLCAGQEPLRPFAAAHLIGGAKLASELDAKRAMREGAELAAAL